MHTILLHGGFSYQLSLSILTHPGALVWLQPPSLPLSLFLLQVLYTELAEWCLKCSSNQVLFCSKTFWIYDALFGLTFKAFRDIILPSQVSPAYLLCCHQMGPLPFSWIDPELPCCPTFAYLIFLLRCSNLHLCTLRSFLCLVCPPQPDTSGSFQSLSLIKCFLLMWYQLICLYQSHSRVGCKAVFIGVIIISYLTGPHLAYQGPRE